MINFYQKKIKDFSIKKKILLPYVEKIILHTGIAKKTNDKNHIKYIFDSINYISNQKPIFSKLKNSISNFKSKKGDLAGIYVTLRKNNLWNFYHKLICIVIPNIKEFNGFGINSLDRFGNFNFSIVDCNIFPDFFGEKKFGININIIIKNLKKYFLEFYKEINFPIK
ncbi:ribosomal protein L5 [Candidatus Carsonella ruddii CS isolate Thao2000]|uniref:50S ribosomal protein L5 n=1 Tax=Candidatus Carsonella ruddii CS isolate Thao2000 TaxID=1202537 RepID=J7GTF8_CARRU|nr:50S ribosomal protein L5 [Candidatus Carsonella ruddii]AFP83819.1 ribosomal protein L5 [Candidatus Carsonella ruddii CS isolate Thao2000]